MLIHIRTSAQQARELLQGLEQGIDQLVFRYTFDGVSDNLCEATFRGRSTQEIELFKELAGLGGQGYVTRHQAGRIASSMLASESISGRCDSPEWLVYLIDMLSTRSVKLKDGWETVFKVIGLNPKDFWPDVTRMTKDITKKASREIIDESIAEATSEGGSSSGEGGLMLLDFGGSASYGEATAEAQATAKKDFSNIMKKSGILGEWQGDQYVPKSIDVHTAADLRQQWGQDLRLEFVDMDGATAHHSINMTKDSVLTKRPSPLCAGKGSSMCWMQLANARRCYVWRLNPQLAQESVTWSGACIDGKVSGKGELVGHYQSEDEWGSYVYEATFHDGKPSSGPVRISEGDRKFVGELLDGLFDGHGELISADGSLYQGEFHNGDFHGRGRLSLNPLSLYEGEFRHGKADGRGTFTGMVFKYEGEFRNGLCHGRGTITSVFGLGLGFTGEFQNGHLISGDGSVDLSWIQIM